ncbi:MAG: SDR family NAD(P)-dependent oxidoreductase [Myxococcota bacterium]|nr:SDR family NAD(P)-dependent oxidoreductase [Myxococcota bacterium]
MHLANRHVVVTGGASGIGRALCRRFAEEGARHVTVADLNRAGAEAVAEEIGGLGLGVDVSSAAAVADLVVQSEARGGPIDLFCSNAGILAVGGVEVPDEEWQRIWEVNVMAHIHAARAVLPGMIERGEGYLLNTASAAGLLSQIGSAPYAVTKHAAVSLAEWLAITHGRQGIKVSVLCPQAVATNMTAGTDSGGVAGVDGMIEPEDVAESVIAGLGREEFLILPHPSVGTYMKRKAGDYDRWLEGMRRLQDRFPGGI